MVAIGCHACGDVLLSEPLSVSSKSLISAGALFCGRQEDSCQEFAVEDAVI